jgi:hypothetical protein
MIAIASAGDHASFGSIRSFGSGPIAARTAATSATSFSRSKPDFR